MGFYLPPFVISSSGQGEKIVYRYFYGKKYRWADGNKYKKYLISKQKYYKKHGYLTKISPVKSFDLKKNVGYFLYIHKINKRR